MFILTQANCTQAKDNLFSNPKIVAVPELNDVHSVLDPTGAGVLKLLHLCTNSWNLVSQEHKLTNVYNLIIVNKDSNIHFILVYMTNITQ